jgi:hypothetical protein
MSDGVVVEVANGDVEVSFGADGSVSGAATLTTLNRLAKVTATGEIGMATIAEGTITGLLTFSKSGSTARENTFPDAAIIVAGINLAQTWTAAQTFNTGTTTIGTADINGGAIDGTIIGAASAAAGIFTTLSASGQITSTVASGTAPFVVASPTVVANLNASLLLGQTWANPGAIGGTTPAAISCTTLTATGTTPGTPSAGQVLIGGGVVKTAGDIVIGGGFSAAGACSITDSTGLNPYLRFSDGTNVHYLQVYSGRMDLSLASGKTFSLTGGANAITTGDGEINFGNGIIDFSTSIRYRGTKILGAQVSAITDAAAVSGTATSGGYGCTDATEFNALISAINAIKDKVNAAFGVLRTHGLLAT